MFGNDRFVWNQMLAMAKERYRNNPSSHFVNEYGMNYLLKRLKQEYPFLSVSDATSFLVVNHNLAQAFKMLFRYQGGYPHVHRSAVIDGRVVHHSGVCQSG
ncbi:hypothetical protein FD34_GL001273 [Limosilactobacillus pontis DSM 8475]|uniref:Transposase putative helix-turn-helix domain-containing protein n=1 Tax=Limosilactobacillus pontis DSM 8475 TaxID=1423794 RepID=A0A922PVM4_9LACO|nr:hypothetical protein FD34_GL001273 [Limosilactobacillus pontis DSM 8475]